MANAPYCGAFARKALINDAQETMRKKRCARNDAQETIFSSPLNEYQLCAESLILSGKEL
jgi:hypothetical protein